jgi:hypothetical protein
MRANSREKRGVARNHAQYEDHKVAPFPIRPESAITSIHHNESRFEGMRRDASR